MLVIAMSSDSIHITTFLLWGQQQMVFISATVTEPVSHQSHGGRDGLHSAADICPLIYEPARGLWSSLLTLYSVLYISKRSRPEQSSQWGGCHSQAGKQHQHILEKTYGFPHSCHWSGTEYFGIFLPVSPRAHPLWLSHPCVYWH